MTESSLPSPDQVLVIRESAPREPQEDLDVSVQLLRDVASGRIAADRVIRLYTPRPTLAMSRLESRMPGFADACRSALALGFSPVVRPTGGRAVAYDQSCLIVDIIARDATGIDPRDFFDEATRALADALRRAGADARVGPVAGEYCPGDYSINAGGRVKLLGTSQRAVRGARLLSGMLPLGAVDRLVRVLIPANAALGLDWDPETFGTMQDETPVVDRSAIESAIESAIVEEVRRRTSGG